MACTRGCVQFCHFSVEEFLLRTPDQWPDDHKEIDFFRLNGFECQRLVGYTCVTYLTVIDFKDPTTEDSYVALNTSWPFLGYVIKYALLHWIYITAADLDALTALLPRLDAIVAGLQFVGLVQYVWQALLRDDGVVAGELRDFAVSLLLPLFADLLDYAKTILAVKISQRLEQFSPDDAGTQPLKALSGSLSKLWCSNSTKLLNAGLPSRYDNHRRSSSGPNQDNVVQAGSKHYDHHAHHDGSSANAIATAVNAVLQSRNMRLLAHRPALTRALQIWVDPRELHRRMVTAFMGRLPISVHVLYVMWLSDNHGKDLDLYVRLVELAWSRTEGVHNFNRVLALGLCPDYAHTYDQLAEHNARLVEACAILSRRYDSPLTRIAAVVISESRIPLLSCLGREDELEQVLDDILAQSPAGSSSHHPHLR